MERFEIIKTVGEEFHTPNIENGEFSYAAALGSLSNLARKSHYKLDLRFYDEKSNVAILIETKVNFKDKDKKQLFDYVVNEQQTDSHRKIIAILANTSNNLIKVWKVLPSMPEEELMDKKLKTMGEYVKYFERHNINNKTAVLENTSSLNRILHDNGIDENLRSQFVGTCLLALKNELVYDGLESSQIIAGIKAKLSLLLDNDLKRAEKLSLLDTKVLTNQNVETIKKENFHKLLNYIKKNILPYIDSESKDGHDILSYFFTTFNKYVAKGDKNQAFTPNHIAHFMVKVGAISKRTHVLDPTCGSGTFLVQAMSQELAMCETDAERNAVKKNQIFGIEFDDNVFGLATTNMLIHGDGNSNIYKQSCYEMGEWINKSQIDLVLMNPPYNASKKHVSQDIAKLYGKKATDPTKGLSFVKFVADSISNRQCRLITLLPMSCAISSDKTIQDFKRYMLERHTLDAVFSFPDEMFYPGASAVACCMVFDLNKPHNDEAETFFGYYKYDGFEKKKGVGRVDVKEKWKEIERHWLELYKHRSTVSGLCVTRHVSSEDEWCAEAYLQTDMLKLDKSDFIRTMREYASFKVGASSAYDTFYASNKPITNESMSFDITRWKWFDYYGKRGIFDIDGSTTTPKEDLEEDGVGEYPYVTTQAVNNGIAGYYNIETEDGNVLTVDSAVLGYCAYQEKSFSASDHVEKLLPKFNMNKYIAMFLVTIINMEQYRYNYGRKCSQKKLKTSKILLPSTNEGNPDWEWIERYIKSLPYSAMI